MKKIIILLCILHSSFAFSQSFYYQNQIITLQTDSSSLVVFDSNTIIGGKMLLISNLQRNSIIESVTESYDNTIFVKTKPNTSFSQVREIIIDLQKNNTQVSTFYSYQGGRVIPTKQIVLNLKANVVIDQINVLFGYKYHRIIQSELTKSYLLDLKDIDDLFSLTESIYQSGLVEWVEPNCISGSLSNTLSPVYTESSSKVYNISPNPAIDKIKIKVIIDSKEDATFSGVKIYNCSGMLVLSQQTDKAKEFIIPLRDLKAGLYLVQITEGEHTEQRQIIIE